MSDLGKIGWVFDGGGFLSSYGVGMTKACWEMGIRPDYIQAVSGGVFCAAKITEQQGVSELVNTWLDVEKGKYGEIFDKRWRLLISRVARNRNSLFDNEGVKRLLSNLDIEKIMQSPIELEVVTINESCGNAIKFFSNRHSREDFEKALYATTALMGILPPAEIKGEIFSDGLYFSIHQALRKRCKTVFVFVNSQPPPTTFNLSDLPWYQRLRHCLRLVIRHAIEMEIESLLREKRNLFIYPHSNLPSNISKMQKATSRRRKKELAIIYLSPTINITSLEIISFKRGDITKAIDHGYEMTRESLKDLI